VGGLKEEDDCVEENGRGWHVNKAKALDVGAETETPALIKVGGSPMRRPARPA
jgi:hypothetical protein